MTTDRAAAPYLPYFHSLHLSGRHDGDDGTTVAFEVTRRDRRRFPCLDGVAEVYFRAEGGGFVEVAAPEESEDDETDFYGDDEEWC